MEKIDTKDKKILYQLNQNSRQSFTQIGKKVGLPKSVVIYRVNRLEKKGIIKNYYTLIDAPKMGYTILRFYFTYQYAPPEKRKEIIDFFVKCKYSGIVHTVEGAYELVVYMFIKNLPEFYKFWEEVLKKYRDYFSEQVLSFYFQEEVYRHLFLVDERIQREKIEMFGYKPPIKLDDIDIELLHLIAPNARIPTSEIAKNLNLTTITITNRIKKLTKSGVIQGFKTAVDLTKIGYRWYKVDIVLKKYNKMPQIINYIKNNPHFICIDKTLGYVDLEMEFYLKNVHELHAIMEDIALKFPDTIRNYKYVSVVTTHKENYIPEE